MKVLLLEAVEFGWQMVSQVILHARWSRKMQKSFRLQRKRWPLSKTQKK